MTDLDLDRVLIGGRGGLANRTFTPPGRLSERRISLDRPPVELLSPATLA
jgi:hypothetical protein